MIKLEKGEKCGFGQDVTEFVLLKVYSLRAWAQALRVKINKSCH